jgi:hypothetical protein
MVLFGWGLAVLKNVDDSACDCGYILVFEEEKII